MIARAAARGLEWLHHRRRAAMERAAQDAASTQERALLALVAAARDTEFGLVHGFDRIRSVAEYQARVPLAEYGDFRPLWERARAGAVDVTWPGRPRLWARTSGTTEGDKLIPVTREALAGHRKGGRDAFLVVAGRIGAAHLLGGPTLFLGGSTALRPAGPGCLVGDLSGLGVRRLPPGLRRRYSPGAAAAIADWDTRLEATARLAAAQDLRLLAGMPSSLLLLFERVARARAESDRPVRDLAQCWPNARALIHGGVSLGPYERVVDEWMGRRLERIEVYPAAEAFVAVQTERSGGLTLMSDYGTFYEFVPVEDLGGPGPRRHTVADVVLGRPYAVAVTTPAGLWSYLLGDTVRFVARDPLRLVVTGRTHHVASAFGESVTVEEAERALVRACRRTDAEVAEFTVAPRYASRETARGGHDWLVEFRVPPDEPEAFARVLDETLVTLNTDYRARRWRDVGMAGPRLLGLPPGTFHAWMRAAGRPSNQPKVPRLARTRELADALLKAAEPRGGAACLAAPAAGAPVADTSPGRHPAVIAAG